MEFKLNKIVRRQGGFSLIELLVTIVIVLLASLAIFGVLSSYEAKKRSTTFVNDSLQSGNYAMFYIDKLVRDAGSGFSQTWLSSYGCQLLSYNSAGTNTTQIFPVQSSTLPTEFSQVYTDSNSGKLVLAPVLIDYQGSNGGTSDALVIMSGNGGNAEYPIGLTATPASAGTTLPAINTIPFQASDLLLMTDAAGATQAPCMMSQVASTFTPPANPVPAIPLPLAGTFYAATLSPAAINTYSKGAQIVDLGNASSDSPPVFSLIGVSATRTLVDYQFLTGTNKDLQVADGVLEMHALYGVDETGAGSITNWVSPSAANFTLANLSTGAPGATTAPGSGAYLLERIKAIRVGLILRTDIPKTPRPARRLQLVRSRYLLIWPA